MSSFLNDISNQNNSDNQETNVNPNYSDSFSQPDLPDEQAPTYENTSEDEALLRREKIHLIDAYKRRFPEKLARVRTDDLDSLDLEQLDLRVKECKADLSVGGLNSMFQKAVYSGIYLTENIVSSITPLRVQGTTAICQQTREMNDIIDELSIDYFGLSYIRPEFRFFMCLGGAMMTAHAANSQVINNVSKPVTENKKEEFKDL